MDEQIKNGILTILKDNYNNIPRYDEKIEQGFREPCFFIKSIEPSQQKLLDNRYRREYDYDLRYFSNTNEDRIKMADNLMFLLEYINLEDKSKIRASKLSYKIEDDETLHLFITYKVHILKQKENVPLIENMDLEERIKSEQKS